MYKEFLRIILGIIFIISGGIKSIDPIGFSFKLEEYFSPQVFHLRSLIPYTLVLSIFIVVLEVILGLFLILKIKLKGTLFCLITLCIFFGFLTFYSAYYNAVTDCGCFGDAIKFTPWQSFIKDFILLAGLLFLWWKYKNIYQENTTKFLKIIIFNITLFCLFWIIYQGVKHEPVIDFRDYKINTDLVSERKKITENPPEYKVMYTLIHKKSHKIIKIHQDDYIKQNYWKDENWEIDSEKTQTILHKEGYSSAIDKFIIEDEQGNNITNEILSYPNVLLVFSYDPKTLKNSEVEKYEHLLQKYPRVYGVSTEKNTFTKIPNLTMDKTAIKTIARSNPFVLVLKNGVITEKKNIKDFIID